MQSDELDDKVREKLGTPLRHVDVIDKRTQPKRMSESNTAHLALTRNWPQDRGTADTITCIEKGKCYTCGGTLFRDYDDFQNAEGETLNCRDCGKSYYNAF